MTKSEQITSLISQKFFLPQYIYTDIYVKDGSQELEFCDCLIEFDAVYVAIQIKERNPSASGSSQKWFEKKVLKIAKGQIKDTFDYFKNTDNTIFSKTSDLTIDRQKTILPVIVFLNTEMDEYQRIVYSQSLDCDINIFSYDDFKTMLETIVIPYDILNYLAYRTVFKTVKKGNVVIDDVDDMATFLTIPQNETDYAELFLARTYYKALIEDGVNEDNINLYNDVLSELNKSINFDRGKFIAGLLCVDYVRADKIARNWSKLMELAKENIFVRPFKITKEDRIYMILARPNTMPEDEFFFRLELAMVYSRHIDGVTVAHIIAIRYMGDEQYSVELSDFDLQKDIRYEELIEKAIEIYG